jgi:hypothetical protein
MAEWVVDTKVLAWSVDVIDISKMMSAKSFLEGMINGNHRLVLDEGKHIYGEYRNVIIKPYRKQSDFAKVWLTRMMGMRNLVYYPGDLPDCHHEYLMGKNFHEDDCPFVGAAFNSTDKNLVAEPDRHYNDDVIEYIENTLEINRYTVDRACTHV